jgi:hypothetical protein
MHLTCYVVNMTLVDLEGDTLEELFTHARSFGETPDTVLRRVLKMARLEPQDESPADSGALTPEGEYWEPILDTLVRAGGRAPGNDVIDELGRLLGGRFTKRDPDVLKMGEVRRRNRARFARLRMKEKGLISSTSPRGIWEITDEGRRFLAARRSG